MASKQVVYSPPSLSLHLLITILFTCPFASVCLLVPQTPLTLQYHKGALLAGAGPIKLHLTFYGDFTPLEMNTIKSFLNSLSETTPSQYIAQVSSAAELHKSFRLPRKSLLSRGDRLGVGRRGFNPSSENGGFSSFNLKASGSSSASASASASSAQLTSGLSSSSSSAQLTSGLSSLKLKASGSSSASASSSSSAQLTSGLSSSSSSSSSASSSSAERKTSGSSSFELKTASASSSSKLRASGSSPTVANWWSLTQAYTDLRGNPVSQTVLIEHEASDNYSLGKLLSQSDVAFLAKRSAKAVSHDELNIHVILTAADVGVEGFCMHACGQHAHTENDGELESIVYAWVGNAREQCPGYCSWPFVRAAYGPDMEPLGAPNGASVDGMIINLAKVLVEAATNPFGDGYYLGGGSHAWGGVGVGGVCTGIYGEGAFPGYPGRSFEDALTGTSFNVIGLLQSKFLLPYIWNPLTLSCAVHS